MSGGALGISFAFIKNIIGSEEIINPTLLFWAWLCWGLSVTIVLASYYTSHLALRNTIKQIDSGTINSIHVGGYSDVITAVFNALGAILFFIGVIFILFFVKKNI